MDWRKTLAVQSRRPPDPEFNEKRKRRRSPERVEIPEEISLVVTAVDPEMEAIEREPRRKDHDGQNGDNANDALKSFLRELGRKSIKLSRDEVLKQCRRWKATGDLAAYDRVFHSHLRWVVSIAKGYARSGKISLLDAIQEGVRGYIRAIEKFDPDAGFALSTYVGFWIKQAITRAIYNTRDTIRKPVHMGEREDQLRKTHQQLSQELRREPTAPELAKAMGMSLNAFVRFCAFLRETNPLSIEGFTRAHEDPERGGILDRLLLEQGQQSFSNPERIATDDVFQSVVLRAALDRLGPREQEVFIRRIAIDLYDRAEETLEQVGHRLGLTRERVRQIGEKALKKLRHRLAQYHPRQQLR